MRFSGINLLVPALALSAFGCGQEKKDKETVYDYYIEDGEFGGEGGTKRPAPGSGDALPKTDPRFTFVSPATDLAGGGVVKIEMSFKDVADDATWGVFYASSQTATDGTAIEADLTVSSTQVDWNTAELADGTYYLYAKLATAGDTGRSEAGVKITVDGGTGDDDGGDDADGDGADAPNTKPTLALDFPTGENVFVAGEPQAIKFTAADADDDALKYRIEYSADGGTTWTELVKDLTEETYDWNVAGLTQGVNYKVRVTADDGKGGTAEATSAKAFGVATTPMTFAAGFGAMLSNRCGNCHEGGGPNQNQFRSDDYDLANIGVADKQANIKKRIDDGTMPPAGPLGAADKAVLTMWIWSGAQ